MHRFQQATAAATAGDPLRIYHKLGLIFHMQKGLRWTPYNSEERRWSAWLYISPPSPLNKSFKLLKWPEMQTYKLLITGTMIAYYSVGMQELYINDDFFVSFWGIFPARRVRGRKHWNRFWLLRLNADNLAKKPAQLYWASLEITQVINKQNTIHLFIRMSKCGGSELFCSNENPAANSMHQIITILPRVLVFV